MTGQNKKMEGETKCACGMPLNEETTCSCEPGVCIYCCSCSQDCQCGCQEKKEKEAEKEELQGEEIQE